MKGKTVKRAGFAAVAVLFTACLLLAACLADESSPAAQRVRPTVRPLAVRYDHTLPAVQITTENIEEHFLIVFGKEYSRGKKLSLPFTVAPISPLYAGYDGSTPGLYIKFRISVVLSEEDLSAEDAEPYLSKEYTVVLNRQSGFEASGTIEVLLKLDRDDVYFRYEIIGCNGRVGP